MSWKKIPMRFPGTCTVCGQKIDVGQLGLWAKGMGVKHEECARVDELACSVCGGPAGCRQCEFSDICDIPNVSQLCICKKCSETGGALDSYHKNSLKKFPLLNS
ncbi:MAG: hypothetical protein D9C04_03730 [Nitrosopumilus sp. B06]|nr:MAG: hypothetical protein EB828_04040 [Nitrosopumilus sp. D6]RNJ79791.1 MAG: hypothetical protein D9C04_03730 [Nitrosopumilus sp. B06]